MRCGGSVADPPDDPWLVEAFPEFAQRQVEFCDRAKAPQLERVMHSRHVLPMVGHGEEALSDRRQG